MAQVLYMLHSKSTESQLQYLIILLIYGNSGYANALQRYIRLILPVLLITVSPSLAPYILISVVVTISSKAVTVCTIRLIALLFPYSLCSYVPCGSQ